MLKEAIDRLAELGSEAAGIEVQHLCNRKLLVRQGTTYSTVEKDPLPRDHVASDLDGFVNLVEDLSEGAGIIFVGETEVIGILDSDTRDDLVRMPLVRTRALDAALELAVPRDQRTVISKLREELYGCCDERLLAVIRRLDFSRTSDGRSHVQHGRESLGKSVEAQVQSSDGEIPEITVFNMPAFKDPLLVSEIEFRCAVTVDPANEKLSFRPMGEQLERELLRVRKGIVERLGAQLTGLVVMGYPGH